MGSPAPPRQQLIPFTLLFDTKKNFGGIADLRFLDKQDSYTKQGNMYYFSKPTAHGGKHVAFPLIVAEPSTVPPLASASIVKMGLFTQKKWVVFPKDCTVTIPIVASGSDIHGSAVSDILVDAGLERKGFYKFYYEVSLSWQGSNYNYCVASQWIRIIGSRTKRRRDNNSMIVPVGEKQPPPEDIDILTLEMHSLPSLLHNSSSASSSSTPSPPTYVNPTTTTPASPAAAFPSPPASTATPSTNPPPFSAPFGTTPSFLTSNAMPSTFAPPPTSNLFSPSPFTPSTMPFMMSDFMNSSNDFVASPDFLSSSSPASFAPFAPSPGSSASYLSTQDAYGSDPLRAYTTSQGFPQGTPSLQLHEQSLDDMIVGDLGSNNNNNSNNDILFMLEQEQALLEKLLASANGNTATTAAVFKLFVQAQVDYKGYSTLSWQEKVNLCIHPLLCKSYFYACADKKVVDKALKRRVSEMDSSECVFALRLSTSEPGRYTLHICDGITQTVKHILIGFGRDVNTGKVLFFTTNNAKQILQPLGERIEKFFDESILTKWSPLPSLSYHVETQYIF